LGFEKIVKTAKNNGKFLNVRPIQDTQDRTKTISLSSS